MTLSEQIDEILKAKVEHQELMFLTKDSAILYRQAIDKMKAYGLITPRGNTYDLTQNGYDAYESRSFDKWLQDYTIRQSPISISNAIIGDNNVGNVQGRDFRDNQSPILTISQAEKDIPSPKPQKKSDHTIWDKVKYVSGVVVGIGSLCTLIAAIGKWLGWW